MVSNLLKYIHVVVHMYICVGQSVYCGGTVCCKEKFAKFSGIASGILL